MKIHENVKVSFLNMAREQSLAYAVNHFQKEGYNRGSLYAIKKRGTAIRKRGSGGSNRTFSAGEERNIVQLFVNKLGKSIRPIAKNKNCSKSTIFNVLKRNGVHTRKRQKAPKYTQKQVELQRQRMVGLEKAVKHKKIVMDDEMYMSLDGGDQQCQRWFRYTAKEEVPDNVRYHQKAKFEHKLLLWLAISEDGVSSIFIQKAKSVSINGQIYQNECLKKRLLPFLSKHYNNDNSYVFWPDLASSHYSRTTQSFMRDHRIQFVEKNANPPNMPQIRPIEDFWGYLKHLTFENGFQADNLDKLERRIRYVIAKIPSSYFNNLMKRLHGKIRKCRLNGAMSAVH